MSKTIIRITLLTSLAHLLFARKPNSNFLVQRGGSDFLEKENEISNDKLLIFNSENISWQLQQQQLMQLRSVYLSEILHKRGVSVPTVLSVSTLDSERAEPIGNGCIWF